MVFFAARIHPNPNDATLAENMPPGYWLSETQLAEMASLIGGIPFTFEHAGITNATHDLLKRGSILSSANIRHTLTELAKKNPINAVVGSVTALWKARSGSWWINIYMDTPFDAIIWLISRNHLRGVSLTHITNLEQKCIPLEVSVCKNPARPGCYIYKAFKTPFECSQYMRGLQSGLIPEPGIMAENTTMSVTATEVPSTQQNASKIELILAELSPDNRQIIEDRLILASSNMHKALTELHETKRLSNITESNLKAQVGVLKAHIDPQILENCHIDNEQHLADLYSNNANDVRRTLDRVLIAANMTLMNYKNQLYQSETPPTKRARMITASAEAKPQPLPEPVSTAIDVSTGRDTDLMRAISDTFEIM